VSASLLALLFRFCAMLALLAALGAGLASFLPVAWAPRVKAALAPVLGLCLGVCVLTTLEWLVPAGRLGPFVGAGCGASLAVAAWRARASLQARPSARGVVHAARTALEPALIAATAFFPIAIVLAAHHSVGPMSYEVFDGPGYVANAQAASTVSIHAAAVTRPSNEVVRWFAEDVTSSNRLDYAPLVAALDALLGLNATQTYAAGLLTILAVGGLGIYGALAALAPRQARLLPALAGMAFGGAFFIQLVFDGSQAALTGLSVIVPLCVLLALVAHSPTPSALALVALLLAGMATLYPIFLFPLALAGALALAGRLVGAWAFGRGRVSSAHVRAWAARFLAVVALAGLFDPVATVRDTRSLSAIASGGGILASFPAYHLGAGVVASWLLQTRDLYTVAFGAQSPLVDLLPALVVPIALVVVVVVGLRRNLAAQMAGLVVVVSLALGAYEAIHNHCGYCEDRSLLVAVPPLIFLVFSGLGTAFSRVARLGRLGLALLSAAYVGYVACDTANVLSRYSAGSVYVTAAERALVARIPAHSGPVELEGFGGTPSSMALEPYLYELVLADGHRVSVASAEEGAGLARDWGPEPLAPPYFDADYRWVLTRLAGVATKRELVGSTGAIALERRRGADLSIEAGIAFSSSSSREAEVDGPLLLVASGGHTALSARLRLLAGDTSRRAGPDASRRARDIVVCVPLAGAGEVKTGRVVLRAAGLRLEGMSLSQGRCPLSTSRPR
jgi:hypothetical protein